MSEFTVRERCGTCCMYREALCMKEPIVVAKTEMEFCSYWKDGRRRVEQKNKISEADLKIGIRKAIERWYCDDKNELGDRDIVDILSRLMDGSRLMTHYNHKNMMDAVGRSQPGEDIQDAARVAVLAMQVYAEMEDEQ